MLGPTPSLSMQGDRVLASLGEALAATLEPEKFSGAQPDIYICKAGTAIWWSSAGADAGVPASACLAVLLLVPALS